MTTGKMVHELRKMQGQIIHGTSLFGEVADRLERQAKALEQTHESLEGYIDGAPDASQFSKVANGICRDIKEALQ